jgi:alkaline phosphatase D
MLNLARRVQGQGCTITIWTIILKCTAKELYHNDCIFSRFTMGGIIVSTLLFASAVTATFDANLNYASPSRRHTSLGIDVPKLAKRSLAPRSWNTTQLNFTHGVASGDPYPNSVILWTRVSPTLKNDESNVTVSGYVPLYNHDTETYIKASTNPICVEYKVGSDKNFSSIVDQGTAYTTSDIDYTVKVTTTLTGLPKLSC